MLAFEDALGDEYADWAGTAAELAEVLAVLLPRFALSAEPEPSERLVRFYVTAGAVTKPVREGREAKFGFRQIAEFLLTRFLLEDGWSLVKAALYIRSLSERGTGELLAQVPVAASVEKAKKRSELEREEEKTPTAAEALVAQFRRRGGRKESPAAVMPAPAPSLPPPALLREGKEEAEQQSELQAALARLGVAAETPPQQIQTRVTIAPWCELVLALGEKETLTPETIEDAVRVFRAALTGEYARREKRKR